MGWENRANRKYYYRKRRAGGNVYSEYLGSGSLADLAAEMDVELKAVRAAERAHHRMIAAEQRQQIELLEKHGEIVRALKDAALLLSGYHTHKGQWRKARVTD